MMKKPINILAMIVMLAFSFYCHAETLILNKSRTSDARLKKLFFSMKKDKKMSFKFLDGKQYVFCDAKYLGNIPATFSEGKGKIGKDKTEFLVISFRINGKKLSVLQETTPSEFFNYKNLSFKILGEAKAKIYTFNLHEGRIRKTGYLIYAKRGKEEKDFFGASIEDYANNNHNYQMLKAWRTVI